MRVFDKIVLGVLRISLWTVKFLYLLEREFRSHIEWLLFVPPTCVYSLLNLNNVLSNLASNCCTTMDILEEDNSFFIVNMFCQLNKCLLLGLR